MQINLSNMLLGANQTQGLLPVYCVVVIYIDPIAKTSIYTVFWGNYRLDKLCSKALVDFPPSCIRC